MPLTAIINLPHILGVFAIVNLWTFMLFGFDKLRAEEGAWRVSEGTLLAWAFCGGCIGAYAGRFIFRHKTRKQPFSTELHRIAFLHMIAASCAGDWLLG
jgi:uncharacterized membrane protein YsdA (DUF1294 family)